MVLLALTACSTRPPGPANLPPPDVPSGTEDTCDAAPYANLIGQDATALEKVLILRPVRVIWPEDLVTGPEQPQRMNFNIAATGEIMDITCG